MPALQKKRLINTEWSTKCAKTAIQSRQKAGVGDARAFITVEVSYLIFQDYHKIESEHIVEIRSMAAD